VERLSPAAPTLCVMPAKAGIQGQMHIPAALDPRFRGNDGKRKRGVIARLAARIVDFARRHAAAIAAALLLLTLAGGYYAATHLTVDTDIDHMLPKGLDWRQNEIALDKAFPQNDTMLVIVIDGATGDVADRAARQLTERLKL
jgi:predicted RND superfamily exporter protein